MTGVERNKENVFFMQDSNQEPSNDSWAVPIVIAQRMNSYC